MFDDGYSKDIEILSKAQTKMLKPFPFDDEWLFFVYKNKKSEDELTSSPLFVGFSSIFIRSIFSDAPDHHALCLAANGA